MLAFRLNAGLLDSALEYRVETGATGEGPVRRSGSDKYFSQVCLGASAAEVVQDRLAYFWRICLASHVP